MLITDIPTLSYAFLALFMIHEFEELIFMHYWLEKHQSDSNYQNEFWVRQYTRWPATRAAFTLMISEEFVLAVLVLLAAMLFKNAEIVVGLFLANALHLVIHLIGAWQIRKWSPGSVTALVTFILSLWIVGSVFASNQINIVAMMLATLTFVVLLVGNLLLLHRYTASIERGIATYIQKLY